MTCALGLIAFFFLDMAEELNFPPIKIVFVSPGAECLMILKLNVVGDI